MDKELYLKMAGVYEKKPKTSLKDTLGEHIIKELVLTDDVSYAIVSEQKKFYIKKKDTKDGVYKLPLSETYKKGYETYQKALVRLNTVLAEDPLVKESADGVNIFSSKKKILS